MPLHIVRMRIFSKMEFCTNYVTAHTHTLKQRIHTDSKAHTHTLELLEPKQRKYVNRFIFKKWVQSGVAYMRICICFVWGLNIFPDQMLTEYYVI